MPDPQPQAPPQPTRHPSRAHSAVDLVGPTSLALSLAPGGLLACLGVHRPPGPRAGQTARPGNPALGLGDLHGLDAVWFLTDRGVLGKTVQHRPNRDGGHHPKATPYPIVVV